MRNTKRLLNAEDALDATKLSDDKIFTLFLDWARSRKLIKGYYLVIYNQTGPTQGEQTHIDRIPQRLSTEIKEIVYSYVTKYSENHEIPKDERIFTSDGSTAIYRTPISRIYDIDLGILVFVTEHKVRLYEIDQFIRFLETTVSVRKQAIASVQNPPFVDLALQEQVQLDHEVGKTVLSSIEANQTHVLSYHEKDEVFTTAYSTESGIWKIEKTDWLIEELGRLGDIIYVQDIDDDKWLVGAQNNSKVGELYEFISKSGCRSALMFDVAHNGEKFAIVICLFARAHAVSMTEVAISRRLKKSLAEYYRLGFERYKVSLASIEAEDVEKKVREALLIADIMHDATDDLNAARSSIDSLTPRTEIERNELANAKKNLKQLFGTAKLFRFLFTVGARNQPSIEDFMSSGSDYYTNNSVREIFEEIEFKYRRVLEQNKITVVIQVPPDFQLKCMHASVLRAIDNCVKNSIRHLGGKTHVKRKIILGAKNSIHAGSIGTEIWVHDNGPGIEEAFLEKVHKPFISNSGGMGLGLAIVSTVCEIHGAELKVDSEWGNWTRISLRFPRTSG